MKKDGLLFLGLAAVGFGLFLSFKKSAPTAQKVGTTNTGTVPATDFWQSLLNRGTAIAGQSANRAVGGGSSGGGTDLTPLIKAGATALADVFKTWFGKKQNTVTGGRAAGTSPGNSSGYGTVTGEASEGGGFIGPTWTTPGQLDYLGYANSAADWQDYTDLFNSSNPSSNDWDNENDLPIEDAFAGAQGGEII